MRLGPPFSLWLGFAEAVGDSCADGEVVLVVVDAVGGGGQEVIGLEDAQGEAWVEAVVESAADLAGEVEGRVVGCRGVAFDEGSVGVGNADEDLAEGVPFAVAVKTERVRL